MESIRTERINRQLYPELNADVIKDVVIVGGGLAGLLTAYMLNKKGADCLVIEADRIMSGVSAYTTAKVSAQHGLIYGELIKRVGKQKAMLYLRSQTQALEL